LWLPAPYLLVDGYSAIPRALAPDGTAVLVEIWHQDGSSDHLFATVPLYYTGAITTTLPSSLGQVALLPATAMPAVLTSGHASQSGTDTVVRYFWSALGPQVLIQDAEGARVYNLATQQTSLLVEPSRVATAPMGIDVVTATDQVFAWAVQCFGLAETSCRAELRRLSLATGAIDVVATNAKPWVFAVSPDGKQIAFADDITIYLKTISP
jgi:hypothetical protein